MRVLGWGLWVWRLLLSFLFGKAGEHYKNYTNILEKEQQRHLLNRLIKRSGIMQVKV